MSGGQSDRTSMMGSDIVTSIVIKSYLKRYIDPQDDRDWFAFEADGSSTYTVQLHGLPEDYDLGIYENLASGRLY